jgi:hypothetical protein
VGAAAVAIVAIIGLIVATALLVARHAETKVSQVTEERKASARWHWEEGNKYVTECGKALIAANVSAPTLFLAFNEKLHGLKYHMFLDAVIFFGIGPVTATLIFGFGYEAQLQYGNFEIDNDNGHRKWAVGWHWVARLCALASAVLFAFGLDFAARSLQ